jgi:signal transduction histidine kinase
MNQAKKRMVNTGNEIEKMYYSDENSVEAYMEMVNGTWGIRSRIVDDDYNIIYSSKTVKNEDKKLTYGILQLFEKGNKMLTEQRYYFSEIIREEDNVIRMVYIKKIDDEKYIILSRSVKSVYENINAANNLTIITAISLMIVGFGFIFHFSKSVTKPILEISKNAKEIANLNFSKKLNIVSNDEIGILAQSINEISDKLSVSIEELKNDINDRKVLVRDMSHELKTPISAVKGYAEGLKYAVADTPEKMNKYCDIIIMECNKMDTLVKEMLEFSKMESINQEIEKEKFEAEKLIIEIQNCFGELIRNTNIHFKVSGDQYCLINGDYNLIERASFNFVENAINHTNQNGNIIIQYGNNNKGFLFQVFNSGSYIKDEEIEDIWKVFFKTDKSRERKGDNFGVGLAIVKATIDLHGGTVGVRNLDDGVEFSFWIPE